jgi:hypothetical protein
MTIKTLRMEAMPDESSQFHGTVDPSHSVLEWRFPLFYYRIGDQKDLQNHESGTFRSFHIHQKGII